MQQQFPITYINKDKGKLQTLAVIPKQIQPSTWKKTRVELPVNLLYHYTPGSTINITSTSTSTSTMTSTFEQFPFQNKQRKEDLLRPYKITELEGEQEKEEEESEDQEFTYQNSIPENPEIETPNLQIQQNLNLKNLEIGTLNIQTPPNQDNPNSELINQQNLPPIIVMDQPPAEPIQLQQIPLQQLQQSL
ncbi:hypothetical protein G9A89_015624 [Geosiphon pyriformis]|nr:hypothetical protein G9A89_015624 [Geosiphon pyriformis]